MRQSLNYDDGVIELAIQGDENRLLVFNPTDFNLASRFYELQENVMIKQEEFEKRAKELDDKQQDDKEVLNFLQENDKFFKGEIDKLFGQGASDLIFNKINVMTTASNGEFILSNFLYAISKFFKKAQEDRINTAVKKYSTGNNLKKNKKKYNG